MPAKKIAKSKEKTNDAVINNGNDLKLRLEVVEKMLLITRDDMKEMKGVFKRIRNRLGI